MITICTKSKSTGEELERLGKLTNLLDLRTGKTNELFDEPLIIRYHLIFSLVCVTMVTKPQGL